MITKNRGFSLLECTMVLAIIAMMAAMAIPNWQYFIAQQRLQVTLNRLNNAVRYARYRAISQGSTFIICPTRDDKHCTLSWTRDVMLMNSHGEYNIPIIIHLYKSIAIDGYLRWQGFPYRHYLQFTKDGSCHYYDGHFSYITDTLSPSQSYKIIVNQAGRLRIMRD